MNAVSTSDQAASARLLRSSIIAAVLIIGLFGILGYRSYFAPPSVILTAAQVEHINFTRADLEKGKLKSAIVQLRDGRYAYMSEVGVDGVWFRVHFPNGEFDGIQLKEDWWMYNIVSITRPTDPAYAAAREKLLPSQ